MQIPGLGNVTLDPELYGYASDPVPIPVLGGTSCRIIIEGYDDDPDREEIHTAIRNFLSASPQVLRDAEPHLFQYYSDYREYVHGLEIASPGGVWAHVHFGNEAVVSRRAYGDQRVYVSVEGECDWEEEHGLQVVFEEGARVSKVGPFDGHLTNSDAFADERLEGVVYHGL